MLENACVAHRPCFRKVVISYASFLVNTEHLFVSSYLKLAKSEHLPLPHSGWKQLCDGYGFHFLKRVVNLKCSLALAWESRRKFKAATESLGCFSKMGDLVLDIVGAGEPTLHRGHYCWGIVCHRIMRGQQRLQHLFLVLLSC